MDASRFKRRETQTPRQATNVSPEAMNGIVSPQAGFRRPVAPSPLVRPAPVLPTSPRQTPQSIAPVWLRSPTPAQATSQPIPTPTAPTPPVIATQPLAAEVQAPRKFPFDMSLPGGEKSLGAMRQLIARGRWFAFRKWALRGAIGVLVLIIGVGGLLFSQGAFKARQVFQGSAAPAASLKANVNPDLLKGEGDGRINILLLGRGGGGHTAPDLTDTMMLVSIDPVNHTQSLLSVPRDLWVKAPNAGSMKINAAWETGEFKYLGKVKPGSTDPKAIQAGFDLVDQTVEAVLGVPIHYNIIVDFGAFEQAIGTVGGVAVNVPADLVDPSMAWENSNNPVLAKAGLQTFDGSKALMYVRSRHTSSDFARSERQRAVLLALKSKVQTLGTLSNPLKISQLLNDFGDNVSSDLSINDASRLYSITSAIDDAATSSIGLADKPNDYITTGSLNGQSIALPTSGLNDYAAIQKYVRSQLKDGFILKENASVMVYNGTTLPGVATAAASTLISYGYNVVGAANTPNTGWTQTTLIDYSGGSAKYTRNYLEQRFKVKAVTKSPDSSIASNGAKFVIIIGSDEATSTQN
ncbi:MAG: LCP family protein [Candidatus Saccharimonadales bacterium]